mmetsp:Transcript_5680/g.15905  ORF Transcript_5680/g.15905 Transcript_5680/m.15905 type:complete len:229 (-) Transcript_5680:2927-3613(-)
MQSRRGRSGRNHKPGQAGGRDMPRYCRQPSDQGHDVRISKKLSSVLRHRAQANGLDVGPDGYVLLDQLLRTPTFQGVSVEQVMQVVAASDKQRFAVEEGEEGLMIRANQGHTMSCIDENQLLRKLELDTCPETVVHGTYYHAWDSIKAGGLDRMARTHVHMAKGLPGNGGVISGMRSSSKVAIYIDVRRALSGGLQFFESDNGVVMCKHVPVEYFSHVVDLHSGERLM